MEPHPLRTTLDALRAERREVDQRAMELQVELHGVARRLMHLNGAIDNIEQLLGVQSEEEEALLREDGAPDEARGATPRIVDFSTTQQPAFELVDEPPLRKRVPSTDWVAEVVNAIGAAADRDTIYKRFEEMRGIPESWIANPRNSFNNALGRAVERRMIMKYGEDEFAPMGWNPFREADSNRGEASS